MTILETDRLRLKNFIPEDASFVLTLLNTPKWIQFIGDRGVTDISSAQRYIDEKLIASYSKNGFGLYLVELKEISAPIGMCGLVNRDELENPDIGFALLPEYEKKGYGFEAAGAVMDYAKNILKLWPILAITDTNNLSSIALLEKLGLRFKNFITLQDKQPLMLMTTPDTL